MIPKQKLKSSDLNFSCSNVKNELFSSINEENIRSNVDSAKKRAVLQGMDYDGFRQMVLGANIFPLKSKELKELWAETGTKKPVILNPTALSFNSLKTETEEESNQEKTLNELINSLNLTREMNCKNFKDFRKKIDTELARDNNTPVQKAQQIFLIVKFQTQEDLKNIFSMDFDVEYFVKLIESIDLLFKEDQDFNGSMSEGLFVLRFLKVLTEIKEFGLIVPKFLSPSEKKKVRSFVGTMVESFRGVFIEEKYFLDEIEKFYLE